MIGRLQIAPIRSEKAMDQSTTNLLTILISIPVALVTLIGVWLNFVSGRPKLVVRITPISLGYQDGVLHQGEFLKGVNSLNHVPHGLELLEVSIHNKRGSAVAVDEVGIAIDSLKNKKEPTYRAFKSFSIPPMVEDKYAGGALEIFAHSSRILYIDFWSDMENLVIQEPYRARGYIKRSDKYTYSQSKKRGFYLLNGSTSFFWAKEDIDLKDILTRRVVRMVTKDADYDDVLSLCDTLIDRLRMPLISRIDRFKARELAVRQVTRDEIIQTALEGVFYEHRHTIAESDRPAVAKIVGAYARLAGIAEVHRDFTVPDEIFAEQLSSHIERIK